jgi:putative membrane protein
MSIRFDFLRFACLAAAALLGACSVAAEDDGAGAASAAADGVVEDIESASQALVLWSDPEIAAFLIAADDSEIAQSNLALTRAADPDVIEFARTMIADHTFANQLVASMLARLRVTPVDNPVSLAFAAQAATDAALLQGLAGPAFDRVYMDCQVRAHYQVLSQLQAQLVAAAPGFELTVQELIPDLRAAMIRGFGAALSIQRSLGRGIPPRRSW